MLPLVYHPTDVKMRMMVARYFGAAKKAILTLQRYYQYECGAVRVMDPLNHPNPLFPHPRRFASLYDPTTTYRFTYVSPLDKDKLIFRAKVGDVDMCIKFV